MYIPKEFEPQTREQVTRLIDAYGFGVLVSLHEGEPVLTHLPMLYEPERGPYGTVVGHLALANPQAQSLRDGLAVQAVFQGPQAYISPSWYVGPGVPTWNYAVAHLHGSVRLIRDGAGLRALLEQLTEKYEAAFESPWLARISAQRAQMLTQQIVGFEISVAQIQGKFKLSQNRSQEDRLAVIGALSGQSSPQAKRVAALMMQNEAGLK